MKSVHSLLQVNAHFYAQQNQWIRNKISKPCRKRVKRTSDRLEKKWTCDLPIERVVSGRHIFEANMNRFALFLQVHGAKPLDDFAQKTLV